MVVVGSVNQDTFAYVAGLPLPGQTILARTVEIGLGGKGANQAVAAARLGADVEFIGLIGDDLPGSKARSMLSGSGVKTSQLDTSAESPTGTALIAVDEAGENTVIVHSGANALLGPDAVMTALDELAALRGNQASLILAQGELMGGVADRLARVAWDRGIRFVLNLAPVIEVAVETLAQSDPLIVNEVEALELVTGSSSTRDHTEPSHRDMAETLAQRYGTAIVVTTGAQGAVVAAGDKSWHQRAPHVDRVVDTTGAGDAFVGALVYSLWRGMTLKRAVGLGVAAGSHAVSIAGTTVSYPGPGLVSEFDALSGSPTGIGAPGTMP